jgi:hypothetical protein
MKAKRGRKEERKTMGGRTTEEVTKECGMEEQKMGRKQTKADIKQGRKVFFFSRVPKQNT